MPNPAVIMQALAIALKRPAPNVIPLSEWEKVRVRNYSSSVFDDDVNERGFLVDQLDGDSVIGRWVSHASEPENATLSIDQIALKPLTIRQYIGELEILYTSPTEFIWHSRLCLPQIKLLRERVLQALFSRRPLVRSGQIAVLQNLLDHATEEGGGKYVEYLMEDIYGGRWPQHPRGIAAYHYTLLLMNSLVESGELRVENGAYRVTPRAVATIISHELEDRRHRDSVAQQRRMVGLTIVLALIGAAQAYISYTS